MRYSLFGIPFQKAKHNNEPTTFDVASTDGDHCDSMTSGLEDFSSHDFATAQYGQNDEDESHSPNVLVTGAYAMQNKRAKFKSLDKSLDNNNGMHASSNGVEGGGAMAVLNGNSVATDANTMFGEYILDEMRKLKTEQFRRKFKLKVQQCLMELMEEEEEVMIAKAINK